MKYVTRLVTVDAEQFLPGATPPVIPQRVAFGSVHGVGEGWYVTNPGNGGAVDPIKPGDYVVYMLHDLHEGRRTTAHVFTADRFFSTYQTEAEASAPLIELAARVSELSGMFKTARDNCRTIADDRDESRQLHASAVRQYQAARAEAEGLRSELAITTRRLAQAKAQLEAHGQMMPEEPRHDGGWYSCAVCSKKTNEAPALSNRHACCSRNVHVGPCCASAVDASLDYVTDIMAGMGHVAGCTNNGRSP